MSPIPFLNVAIGELLWDLLPTGARLGGATANYAILSARLGQPSALVSSVGDDELGHEAMERLSLLAVNPLTGSYAQSNLDLDNIKTSGDLPTGTVTVTLDGEGRPHYEIASPVAWDAIQLSPGLLRLAPRASVIYFGTLAQRHPTSRDTLRGFIAAATPDCMRVCDLNLRQPFGTPELLRWSLAHADVLKASEEELPEIGRLLGESSLAAGPFSGDETASTQAAAHASETLLRLAPQSRLIAITLGPHGSFLADRNTAYRHTGYRVKVVDTIGAGDAFTAGMVYAYMRNASLLQVSDVANRCGSYVASQPGATPKLPELILQSIREILGIKD